MLPVPFFLRGAVVAPTPFIIAHVFVWIRPPIVVLVGLLGGWHLSVRAGTAELGHGGGHEKRKRDGRRMETLGELGELHGGTRPWSLGFVKGNSFYARNLLPPPTTIGTVCSIGDANLLVPFFLGGAVVAPTPFVPAHMFVWIKATSVVLVGLLGWWRLSVCAGTAELGHD